MFISLARAPSGMSTVAVIGGSNGGYATAADLRDRGHDVRWYVRTRDHHPVIETGELTLRISPRYPDDRRNPGTTQTVQIGTITTNIGRAVRGADWVLVPLPTTAQPEVVTALTPHLEEGQCVVFAPGNLGSVLLRRALIEREDVTTSAIHVAETPTLPYVTRRSGEQEVTINLEAVSLPVGAFPGRHSEALTADFTELYERAQPASNALDCALTNSNPCVNAAPTVLNAGAIECDEFTFNVHRHGIGPSVYAVIQAIDAERIAIRDALGYGPPHFRQEEYYRPEEATTGEHFYGGDSRAALMAAETFAEDPPSLEDRYIDEDIAIASVLWSSVGKAINVETPTIDAIIDLASTMRDREYREIGRSLASLDLEESDLARRLQEGFE